MKRYNQDMDVNSRFAQHLMQYPHFVPSKSSFSTMFAIRHYGGIVKYDCEKMVTKNRDRVSYSPIKQETVSKTLF